MKNKNLLSVFLAILVTVLWSTSFIIIKFGLEEIPPLLYAGLRYFIAFLCFLPIILKQKYIAEIKQLSKNDWWELVLLGVVFYTLTQGMQFLGLSYLPAVLVSLILNFTPLIVALLGIGLLKEAPRFNQWMGIIFFILGILIYFLPVKVTEKEIVGIIIMLFGTVFNAVSALLGRHINKKGKISTIVITAISMGIGSIIMLTIGLSFYNMPSLSLNTLVLLLWLAVINTAVAFTIWNYTLKHLNAVESSIINGTMLIQIGALAWIMLGEEITVKESIGMLIAAIGAVLVQLKFNKNFYTLKK
ncbi:MAG: DMT family transporter [bacterium]